MTTDDRQAAGLALGRALAQRYGQLPGRADLRHVQLSRPQPRETLAERLLAVRDWRALESAFEDLDARSQEVLDLRHGLRPNDPRTRTWDEIAEQVRVSRSRAQQLHAAAVAKLDALLE